VPSYAALKEKKKTWRYSGGDVEKGGSVVSLDLGDEKGWCLEGKKKRKKGLQSQRRGEGRVRGYQGENFLNSEPPSDNSIRGPGKKKKIPHKRKKRTRSLSRDKRKKRASRGIPWTRERIRRSGRWHFPRMKRGKKKEKRSLAKEKKKKRRVMEVAMFGEG